MIHVAAIRSTGLSAALAIGEQVAGMLAEQGTIPSARPRALATPEHRQGPPWWERAASMHASAGRPPDGQDTAS